MPLPPVNTQGPIALSTPAPIHVRRYVRNGLTPNASFETDVGGALNFVAASRRKNLFTWCVPIASIPGSTYSARTRWRFSGHTGPLLRQIRATVVLALKNTGDPISTPAGCTLYITNADGSVTYGSGSFYSGNTLAPVSDVPSEFSYGEIIIGGVPANTAIYGRLDDGDGGGRLIAATVYEEALKVNTTNGYPQSQVSVTSPIYDDRREDLYTLATDYWKQGASPLINWTVDNQANPLTNATDTARNIVDNSSTAVGPSAPGWVLDTRYCRTRTQSTVPCVLKAFGNMSAGTGGNVILLDSAGNTVASITNGWSSPTGAWVSTTVNLPAALDTYYVHFSSTLGAGTFSLGACSLHQYAA